MIQLPTAAEDTAEPGAEDLRGVIEHVGSGRRQPFRDTRELVAFLRAGQQCFSREAE